MPQVVCHYDNRSVEAQERRRQQKRDKKRASDQAFRENATDEELAAKRQKVNASKQYQRLWKAVGEGNLDQVVWLIESKGLDPNYVKNKMPLFVNACRRGQAHIALYLALETSCDVTATVPALFDFSEDLHHNCTGWDAAIYEGQLSVHDVLLQAAESGQLGAEIQSDLERNRGKRGEAIKNNKLCIEQDFFGSQCGLTVYYGDKFSKNDTLRMWDLYEKHKGEIMFVHRKKGTPPKYIVCTLEQLRDPSFKTIYTRARHEK